MQVKIGQPKVMQVKTGQSKVTQVISQTKQAVSQVSKLVSILLTVTVMFTMFVAIPQTAYAAPNEKELVNYIRNFNPGNGGPTTGQLSAVADTTNHTVTVSGNVTDAQYTLTLNIDAETKVIWVAQYSGWTKGTSLLELTGAGTFEVSRKGSVTNLGPGHTIKATSNQSLIRIDGGTAEAASVGNAINTAGSVEVNKGTVTSTTANAIVVNGSAVKFGASVLVSGGEVKTTQSGNAIYTTEPNIKVVVSGGLVSAAGSKINAGDMSAIGTMNCAISARGAGTKVSVTGGVVQSTAQQGIAIVSSYVSVSGGVVEATGANGSAITTNIQGSDILIGGGKVASQGMPAIIVYGYYSTIEVTGGHVINTGFGHAILNWGDYSEIKTYCNAVIEASKLDAIRNEGRNVEITIVGGQIKAGLVGDAIHNNSATGVNLNMFGGEVSATLGHAIYSEQGHVDIYGGFLFAYGTSVIGENQVLYVKNGYPLLVGCSAACAWNKAAMQTTYIAGTTSHLVSDGGGIFGFQPAVWGKVGTQSGICYYGCSEGFFPIDIVNVNPPFKPHPGSDFVSR
ncbi:MAG: hypothetical protein LBU61_01965 [Coriobacteriales bacterium]|jgi:hypothetical protein|nr:hypothetical protein [Coriobacteriales bacterium]